MVVYHGSLYSRNLIHEYEMYYRNTKVTPMGLHQTGTCVGSTILVAHLMGYLPSMCRLGFILQGACGYRLGRWVLGGCKVGVRWVLGGC